MTNLIIVESPTKAKTISKFLGAGYQVESSQGHVRDLPKSKLGIDLENNFQPQYITIVKARKRVNELKKIAAGADKVILATDEDREGEAIAWHLVQALGLNEIKNQKSKIKTIERIVFHEITDSAIKEALKNPREIDLNMVDAQQARRILDRLVGYQLSPFLWQKVAKGLSAGRVQSAAVRLIAEREREIEKFKPAEYWTISAHFNNVEAQLIKIGEKTLEKFDIPGKKEAEKILKNLEGAKFKVLKIEKREIKKNPPSPFITSTLQQVAWQRFHFSAKQTMMFAQQLYEQGLITYMRTDSLNLSEGSLNQAEKFIKDSYGENYSQKNRYKTKSKTAQEAHEAIRPTDLFKEPSSVDNKLYDLIWRRFVASQIKPMILDSTSIDIEAKNHVFKATGSIIKFDGFSKVYPTKLEENVLPELKIGQELELEKLDSKQHFTEPLPRYTEASLVKALEKFGIGRPSTYAPIMSTIQDRNYVTKDQQRRFYPTEIGLLVNDLLVNHFPEIVDIKFTAHMEEDLDQIAAGEKKWPPIIEEFYKPFSKHLEIKYKEVKKNHVEEKSDQICEKCGKPMLIKFGRFGKFLACSGFPECKTTKSISNSKSLISNENGEKIKCPKCNEGDIVMRQTKKRRVFYGCSRWPACDFASWKNPSNLKHEA